MHHIDLGILMPTDYDVNDVLTEIKKFTLKNILVMINCYYP